MNPPEPNIMELKERARKAAAHSYSPYSRFPVGAAVAGASGEIYAGCNVENASFGLTQCAERTALTPGRAARRWTGIGTQQSPARRSPGAAVPSSFAGLRDLENQTLR